MKKKTFITAAVLAAVIIAAAVFIFVSAGKKHGKDTGLSPVYPTDKYRTTYEVFVRSFADGMNNDGIGDLRGLIQKLDYINDGDPASDTSLGCSQIWLMPVFPSPTYHKYDVTDYKDIDPEYDGCGVLLISFHR